MGLDLQTLLKIKKDANGENVRSDGKELVFNVETKQLEEKTKGEINNKPSTLITIRPEDADMFASSLVIEQNQLVDILRQEIYTITFECIDDGDVYVLCDTKMQGTITGCICFEKLPSLLLESQIYLVLSETKKSVSNSLTINNSYFLVSAYYYNQKELNGLNINMIPIKEELFSRVDGLYETGKIANTSVVIIGLGSGGSPIALELVKAGVINFSLIDDDRLEIANVVRHVCGIKDLGRYKTKAVKGAMLNKNPYANIDTYEMKADLKNEKLLTTIISESDLVICATDNRESKILTNKICIEQNKVCLYGGAFRRACGGQVLRVIPQKTICYGCFLNLLPSELTNDFEISNQRQASRISYSDRVVPIEPGLSSDILPISTFIVKLAILELLKGKEHSMKSLYDDFSCSLYLWINRREYQFSDIHFMGDNVDEISVMRWYGIKIDKDPNCLVCGNKQLDFNDDDMIF